MTLLALILAVLAATIVIGVWCEPPRRELVK
jgi:hypothetical protein